MSTNTLPDGLPPLPPVPDGFDRWEYRGERWNSDTERYAYIYDGSPCWTVSRGHTLADRCHYLEAVRKTPPAEPAPLCPHCGTAMHGLGSWPVPYCPQCRRCIGDYERPEQPPRQEGETDADTSAASGQLATLLEDLSADEKTIPHDVYLALAARHIRRLLKKEEAAERRAADAEAELAKWRIISDGDTPEGASERLGEIKSKVESVIAMVEQTDTLPADSRFVEKPHPDSLRLDWLASGGEWPTYCDGWHSRLGEHDSLRAAIDAMSAPSAKGEQP